MIALQRPYGRVLVANRGEIACRVMRTARFKGLETVAIYSDADCDSLHVRQADLHTAIGGALPRDSYLNVEAILAAVRRTGADAVHPGYGFLAENPDFAEAVIAAGVVWIGPSPHAIRAMGNKARAKNLMRDAGVPCIPGYDGPDQSDTTLVTEAARVGYPLMVKAASGGGGRGMRLVLEPAQLPGALQSARAEALAAFGSDELILERALTQARHVEVQVFGDAHGNVIHLGERDCSVQRRHQKLIEESPCPAVDPGLREALGQMAVRAARAIGYVGAGTVECLLAPDGQFYFMEMNTRLQVEHAVTEAVTGYDLVAWQLDVAAGLALETTQDKVRLNGHAIEARLTAEDVTGGFMPQTGTVLRWQPSDLARIDHGLAQGVEVSPYYDSMLAKVIAHGATRDEARRKLAMALGDTVLLGVTTNQSFLIRCLEHPDFIAGDCDTGFVDRAIGQGLAAEPPPQPGTITRAAALALGGDTFGAAPEPSERQLASLECHARLRSGTGAWDVWLRYPRAPGERVRARLKVLEPQHATADGGQQAVVALTRDGLTNGMRDGARGASSGATSPAAIELEISPGDLSCIAAREGQTLYLKDCGCAWRFEVDDPRVRRVQSDASGEMTAPLSGRIAAVHVSAGQAVARGQALVVMEAMKMEHVITAPFDGEVAVVSVAQNDQVRLGALLVRVLAPG